MEVVVLENGERSTRTTKVEIKVAHVTIKQPQRRGKVKDSELPDEITEISTPPKGEEASTWVLLTSLKVPNFESTWPPGSSFLGAMRGATAQTAAQLSFIQRAAIPQTRPPRWRPAS